MITEMIFNFTKIENVKICFKRSFKNAKFMSKRYLIDMIMLNILMFAAKYFTCGYRPHFFETCLPDRNFNCTLGTFVSNYTCTNTEASRFEIYDASMSFFSGHAAVSVFSCFFIIW